jgi:cytochrome d ubiquinol oxidase subunit II
MRLAPLPLFTAACGALLWVWAGRQQRELAPFLLALGVFAGCYAGLGVSLYPYVVPHAVTLAEAASSPASQRFLLVGTLVLLPIILGYTAWTYWVFRGKVHADSGYGH